MIRVIIYLIVLAGLAYGAVWLAERPGEVAITWQGERIDTSVMVAAAAVVAVAVAAVLVWSILRAIMHAPHAIARYRRERRGQRGYRAVSRGLIAVGSGDARSAQKFTAEALRIAPREPLTLLLTAPRSPGVSSAKRASGARPRASSSAPGASIRIPISPLPTPRCAPAIPRASASLASRRSRPSALPMRRPRSRSRAPRSMRRNFPSR